MQTIKTFAAAALALLAGCATWTFEPLRSQKFVDEAGRYAHVDYDMDDKAHESVFRFDYGGSMRYSSKEKVRVEMPNGDRFVAYKHMSPSGNLYKTDDESWEFYQQGTGCIVAERAPDGKGFLIRYQGTLCASVRNPLNEKRQRIRGESSTPRDFGHDSSGPRDAGEGK